MLFQLVDDVGEGNFVTVIATKYDCHLIPHYVRNDNYSLGPVDWYSFAFASGLDTPRITENEIPNCDFDRKEATHRMRFFPDEHAGMSFAGLT